MSEWVIERVNKQRNNDTAGIMATNLHGIVFVRLQTNISCNKELLLCVQIANSENTKGDTCL